MNNPYSSSSPPSQPPVQGSPAGPSSVPVQYAGTQPVVAYILLGVTILSFLLQLASPYLISSPDSLTASIMRYLSVDPVAAMGMKVNELILAGQFWRLFTPMLLHGSILHLGFNMYALYALGPGLERYYGHGRFLALYIIAGFAGNVVSFLFSPAASLGSSTAIFGLLGAEGVFLYRNHQVFGKMAQRALINLAVVAGINLMLGFSTPGIDNMGHIGGLIGGTLFAWIGGPVLRLDGIYPNVQLVDERDTGDALRAGLVVGGLFILLTMAAFFLRGTG